MAIAPQLLRILQSRYIKARIATRAMLLQNLIVAYFVDDWQKRTRCAVMHQANFIYDSTACNGEFNYYKNSRYKTMNATQISSIPQFFCRHSPACPLPSLCVILRLSVATYPSRFSHDFLSSLWSLGLATS
jgi:hypothetical protein